MASILTKKQREAIENLARTPDTKYLYEEESLSGWSWTLRAYSEWAERGRWGMCSRSRSCMVLSVVRPDTDDETLIAAAETTFNTKVAAARALFAEVRQQAQSA